MIEKLPREHSAEVAITREILLAKGDVAGAGVRKFFACEAADPIVPKPIIQAQCCAIVVPVATLHEKQLDVAIVPFVVESKFKNGRVYPYHRARRPPLLTAWPEEGAGGLFAGF